MDVLNSIRQLEAPNKTKLLGIVSDFKSSYEEIIQNRDKFGNHANSEYMKNGPLRECKTFHLAGDINPENFIPRDVKIEWPATSELVQRLRTLVDITNSRKFGRLYLTILEPGKRIYTHADHNSDYWNNIDRYQFYYTGNNDIQQIINKELFPVGPGYFYHFDHSKYHRYLNNSNIDMVLLVFDLFR